MKTSTRWLTGFGIGLAALIIVTLVLVFTVGQRNEPSFPANTPEGTVQRYLLAIQANDLEKAKTYIMKDSNYYFKFSQILNRGSGFQVILIKTEVTGNNANVYVSYKPAVPPQPFGPRAFGLASEFTLEKYGDNWTITGDLIPMYLD